MNPNRDFGHIGKTQRAVIDDILVNGLSERETLEKHKVSPSRYRRWLENGVFRRELDTAMESASRQAKLTVALSLPRVAARLAKLIDSEKDEVARKACLDVINLQKADQEQQKAERAEQDEQEDDSPFKMTDAQASKIWAILANKDEPDTEPRASATALSGGMARSDTERSEAERGHVNTDTLSLSQDLTMSYGERIEKKGLPQSGDVWPLPQVDDVSGGMARSDTERSEAERGHVPAISANPEREAGLKRQREADLALERATERRRLLARPARGIDLSAKNQNQNNNKVVIRSY